MRFALMVALPALAVAACLGSAWHRAQATGDGKWADGPWPAAALPTAAVGDGDARPDAQARPAQPGGPLVLAHRGASGHLPEHTLAAYTLAWAQGADFLEPDVVMTRDGVAICAHDVTMERVTDVAERFPDRARQDGHWYWADFTLDEVRSLQVVHQGVGDAVPTFESFLRLVDRLNAITGPDGRPAVGVIPEPKRPAFHRSLGLDVEGAVVGLLARFGYASAEDPAIVQCFELDALERLHDQGCALRLVWLVDEPPDQAELRRAAGFCHGLGPSRWLLEDRDSSRPLPLLEQARALGLALYPYTFKDEPQAMARFFHQHGVDGLFTDYPAAGRRAALQARQDAGPDGTNRPAARSDR